MVSFLARFRRIKNPQDIKSFWKLPTHKNLYEKLGYDDTGNPSNKLLPPKSELEYDMVFQMERHNLPRGNKYHESHRVCGTKTMGIECIISWF